MIQSPNHHTSFEQVILQDQGTGLDEIITERVGSLNVLFTNPDSYDIVHPSII